MLRPRSSRLQAWRSGPVRWWHRDGWPHTVLHVGKVIAPYVAGAAVAIAAIAGVMWRPTTVSSAHRADYVIIVGSAGLRWDDVNPTDTPTLWSLAGTGSIAAMSVKSSHTPTCPADGWLTLGAGNYARYADERVDDACPIVTPDVTSPDGITSVLAGQTARATANTTVNGTELGALPDAVRCTEAIGSNAALAAARPYGRVDRYSATMPADPSEALSTCPLTMVDAGTVSGPTPDERQAQAQAVDAQVARVLAARPPDSLVIVAGLSQTYDSSRLHVVIADGPGYHGGWLTSTSTGRQGYLELVDLAPTALAALDLPAPTKLLAGAQAQRAGTRAADPGPAIARLADADDQTSERQRVSGWFFTALLLGEVLLLSAAVPLLRRARRSTELHGPKPASPRLVRQVEVLLIGAALAIAVALLTDIVPWWRAPLPGLVFAALGAVLAAAGTVLVLTEPWSRLSRRPRRPSSGGVLGPLTSVSAIVVAVIGIDIVTGSHLELNSVAGYSAAEGTRYAGIGAVGLGAFIVGILMLAACVAQLVPDRRWRPFVVAAIGALGVIVAGSPQLGADAGGALALTIGVCVAAAIASGGWLTFTRLGWATLAGLAVLIGFAVLDLRRPVTRRGPVGTMLTQLHAGMAGHALQQTVIADVATVTNPLSLLVLVAVLYALFVLARPWGGLMRLFGLYPAIRGALTAMVIASVVAGLLDGVGFMTAGAAAAVGLPLVTLAALRVLDHADDRTVSRIPVDDLADPALVGDVRPSVPQAVTRPGTASFGVDVRETSKA